MQYNGPFDQPGDPNASYVNGNPRTGIQGSIPPAAAFESPQRELANFITKNSLTPTDSDLYQLCRAYQNACIIYGTDLGTENTLSVALDPIPSERVPGLTVRVKKGPLANTGACTLNIGLGADALVRMDGANLNNGELPGSCVFETTWDGTRWQLKNYMGVQTSTQTINNNYVTEIPYCVDTSVTANTIVAPFAPAITSVNAGKLVLVKLNRAFTGGAVNILVNALASKPVIRGDQTNPLVGDGFVGQILMLEFDGTSWQIVNSFTPSKPLPIILADVKSLDTPGGSFTSGAWRTRDLNSVIADPFGLVAAGLVTLSGNRFTLAAGKWIVRVRAPSAGTRSHLHRIWNVTDNSQSLRSTFFVGATEGCTYPMDWDFIDGMIDIASTKTFELQGHCALSVASVGFGVCNNSFNNPNLWFTGVSGSEIYSVLELTKVS